MIPQISVILNNVPMILMVMAIKALITPHRISCHLIWPLEEWLVFNLFQNLLYWLSEHSINRLGVGKSRLPNKIFSRSVVLDLIWLEIPPLLRDYLRLSFPLLLVLLYSSILINLIHQLTYIGNRFTSERLSQVMFCWEASLKSTNGHIIIAPVYFVKYLLVSIWVSF